jgi:CHASE3 domain sensor protein
MLNEQLIAHIRTEFARGIDRAVVIRSLLTAGWKVEDINAGIAVVDSGQNQNIPATSSLPTPSPSVQSLYSRSILPVILILIALLVIGGGAYVYTQNKKSSSSGADVSASTATQNITNMNDAAALLARIKNGEKPNPAEVKSWLSQVATIGFPADAAGTSIAIVPVLMLMDQDYSTYKEVALSILQDANGSLPLRFAMLELAGRHWDDSRATLEEIFQRPTDDSVLQGSVSLILAGHGENIGDLVVQRYPNVSPEAKFYYAQAITALGRKDAIPMLLTDAQQTQNSALHVVVIQALIKLDPSLSQTLNIVMSVIHSAKAIPDGQQRTTSDLDRERVAMAAVSAIAAAGGQQIIDRLLAVARDESVAIDVRLTSLEALASKVGTMSSSEQSTTSSQLVTLSNQVSKSGQLSDMNKERMAGRITMLQKLLK